MEGIGVPLATPFDEQGDLDKPALRDLVGWVEDRGVDFFVPCGSTSEAPLMTPEERARVISTVVGATDLPVFAGTGTAALRPTLDLTERAAADGADGALVVAPYYYPHDQATFEAYYRDLADESPLPVYLYTIPQFTGGALDPETVGRLATHENVRGMKDSSGDVEWFQRTRRRTADATFDLVTGAGAVLAPTLDAGGDGAILALANVAPEAAVEIYRRHGADPAGARELSSAAIELIRSVTSVHGVPGLKAAMRDRGAPAGYARRPFGRVDDAARDEIAGHLDRVLDRL
jgi:dihydrodipicolinate synthase/N-acetylneuraminate lyase